VSVVQSSCSFSAALLCGRKRHGAANKDKKAAWWNQELKGAIGETKVAFKAWLYNKVESSFHARHIDARKSAALAVEKSEM